MAVIGFTRSHQVNGYRSQWQSFHYFKMTPELIIDLVKKRFGERSDARVAYLLDVTPPELANWKNKHRPMPMHVKLRAAVLLDLPWAREAKAFLDCPAIEPNQHAPSLDEKASPPGTNGLNELPKGLVPVPSGAASQHP